MTHLSSSSERVVNSIGRGTYKEVSVKLEIVGPLSSGQFHVHSASCADLGKSKYDGYRTQRGALWTGDYTSRKEVIEDIFSDFLPVNSWDDSDDEVRSWEGFENEVQFFPCCNLKRIG
jgi:hypothetical protein